MLSSIRRNVNVLIEAGGFYSRKYGILELHVGSSLSWRCFRVW